MVSDKGYKMIYRNIFLFSFLVIFFIHAEGQNLEYAKSIVQTLTSEEFHGRGYVNQGTALAANYIENQFDSLQIEIVKQPHFQVPVNTFPEDMHVELNDVVLAPGAEYLVDPSAPTLNTTATVQILSTPELLHEDKFRKALQSANNRILAIYLDGINKTEIQDKIQYLKTSEEINVTAVLLFDDTKLTWGLSQRQAARPLITINKIVRLTPNDSVTIDIKARYYSEFPVRNVVGKIEGLESDSIIVFTAHYDHLGRMGRHTYFPGANDNASGVALLLNLAAHFSKNPPRHTMLFIAFAAEELGLLGSQFFIKKSPIDVSKIKFLINFDLAGTGDQGIKVVNATKHPDHFDTLTSINQRYHLLPAVEERGEACISDHCPFDMVGVPCFYSYTLGGIQAYHDIYDKYETLPFTEFIDYAQLIIHFAASL